MGKRRTNNGLEVVIRRRTENTMGKRRTNNGSEAVIQRGTDNTMGKRRTNNGSEAVIRRRTDIQWVRDGQTIDQKPSFEDVQIIQWV